MLSYIMCIIAAFSEGVGLICDSSSEAISSMQSMIDELNKFGLISMQLDFSKYCSVAEDLGAEAVFLFVGLVIMVISQAGLLACLASYKSRVSDAMFIEEKLDEEKRDLTTQLDSVQQSYSNLHDAEELQRSIERQLEEQLRACERARNDALEKAREGETEVAVLRKSCDKLKADNHDLRDEIALLRKTDAGITPMKIGSSYSRSDIPAQMKTSDEFQQSWFSCGCDKA